MGTCTLSYSFLTVVTLLALLLPTSPVPSLLAQREPPTSSTTIRPNGENASGAAVGKIPLASEAPLSSAADPVLSRSQESASSFTISGRVTDSGGDPVQGVTITAMPETGKVVVKDEGDNPVNDAQVFRNGSLAGTSGADGTLTIQDLAPGDELAARQLITEVPTKRSPGTGHNVTRPS